MVCRDIYYKSRYIIFVIIDKLNKNNESNIDKKKEKGKGKIKGTWRIVVRVSHSGEDFTLCGDDIELWGTKPLV